MQLFGISDVLLAQGLFYVKRAFQFWMFFYPVVFGPELEQKAGEIMHMDVARYVNVKGGPDRRFNNDLEIPIVLYEVMSLTSKSGLLEMFYISRTGIGSIFNGAVKQMASEISRRVESKTEDGYFKCPRNNCDIFIEFPAHGLGQTITCSHCGMETILFKSAAALD